MGNEFIKLLPAVFLIGILSYSIFRILQKAHKGSTAQNILYSLSVSPLFLSLSLYTLFYFSPGKPNLFYIKIITVPVGVIFLLSFFFHQNKNGHSEKIDHYHQKITTFSKILAAISAVIILMVSLRTTLWPVTWDDQILYIKQAYAMGQVKDAKFFLASETFDDGIVNHQMNSAIRPGLFVLYDYFYLFDNSYPAMPYIAQSIIFYYFLLTIMATFLLAKKITGKFNNAIFAVFLLCTCYLFTCFTIYGFKEAIICALVLLSLILISEISAKEKQITNSILLGLLIGLLSFVNFAGSVIGCILLLCLFIYSGKFFDKFKTCLTAGVVALAASGNEFYSLFSWIIQTIIPNIPLVGVPQNPFSMLSEWFGKGAGEFNGYRIKNSLDVYTKGKFQGLFQIQNFGLILPLFLVTLIFKIRNFIKDRNLQIPLAFILVYSFIFFDPLSLNHHPFAYVLAVSSKYTLILIPIAAALFASQLDWISNIFRKIQPKHILILSALLIPVMLVLSSNSSSLAFSLIKKVVPLFRSEDYYINFLNSVFKLGILADICIIISIAVSYIRIPNKFVKFWQKQNISLILVILTIFLVPFGIIFNSNYGIRDIFLKSFASKNEKLTLVKGQEEVGQLITYINKNLPHSEIMVFGEYGNSFFFNLDKPSSQVYLWNQKNESMLPNFLSKNKINIVVINKNSQEFKNLKLSKMHKYLYQTQNNLIVQTN